MRTDARRRAERIRQRRKRERQRAWVTELKVSIGCADCPERHPATLQFHHLDPSTKVIRVSHAIAINMPKAQLLAEIAKCIVLCSNCHAKRHWNEQREEMERDLREAA